MHALKTALMTYVRPRAAFERLRERPAYVWLWALVVLVAATTLHTAVYAPRMIELQNEVIESQGLDQGEDAIPANVRESLETVSIVTAYVAGPLGLAAGALIVAVILYAVAKAWGAQAGFALTLGTVVMARLPEALRALVQSGYMLATGSWVDHQGLGAMVATPDVLTSPNVGYALLSLVDAFSIWSIVLFAVGLVVALGLPRKRALIIVGAYVALGVVMTVVPVALSSAVMPT